MRMPDAKIRARDISGAADRSSHTAELWVIVTSLSTPSPATMTAQVSRPRKSSPVALRRRFRADSSPSPVSRAASIATTPSAAVTSSPKSVPASAVDVRTETPWAR